MSRLNYQKLYSAIRSGRQFDIGKDAMTVLKGLADNKQSKTRFLIDELYENYNGGKGRSAFLLKGPPGTGKSIVANILAAAIVHDSSGERENIFRVQFHPSTTYEDCMGGIRPVPTAKDTSYHFCDGWLSGLIKMLQGEFYSYKSSISDIAAKGRHPYIDHDFPDWDHLNKGAGELRIHFRDGSVLRYLGELSWDKHVRFELAESAAEICYGNKTKREDVLSALDKKSHALLGDCFIEVRWENSEKEPYVIIIDEINRTNTSAVLGERMQVMEKNKPGVIGPNGKLVTWPSNLALIGTMNLADHTLSDMDKALCRRFVVRQVEPDYEVVPKDNGARELMKLINDILLEETRTEKRLLGQSYFLSGEDERQAAHNIKDVLDDLAQQYPELKVRLKLDQWEGLGADKRTFFHRWLKLINVKDAPLENEIPQKAAA